MSRAAQLASSVQDTSGGLPPPVHGERSSGSALAFSQMEEDFFRAGDALALTEVEDFSDLNDDRQPVSLWRALLGWLRGERAAHGE